MTGHQTESATIGAALLPDPELEFDGSGTPISRRYGDRYHHQDGVGERRQVFIAGQHLPERFAALRPGDHFQVGELGFGTGLTTHLIAETFLACAPADTYLHITSFESTPLRNAAWRELAARRAHLGSGYAALARQAPPPIPGWHRRWLDRRIRLSLFHGDAATALTTLCNSECGGIDAWCLDGFAPNHNPGAWAPTLLALLPSLCARGATLASFTAVGEVRRGLEKLGFRVERAPGAPYKWHHLRAVWLGPGRQRIGVPTRPVQVVGGGLAGSTLAHALHARGIAVTVTDAAARPPGGASANPAAALHLRVPQHLPPRERLRLTAYSDATAWFDALRPRGWHADGLLHLAFGRDRAALAAFADALPELAEWVDAGAASERAGLPLSAPGIWLRHSGHADLAALSSGLSTGVPVHSDVGAVFSPETAASTAAMTIWCAPNLLLPLGVRAAPGTVTLFTATAPSCALSGDGYLVPLSAGHIASGGTYDHLGDSGAAARNHRRAVRFGVLPSATDGSFSAVRYGTADRLPLVGMVSVDHWVSTAFGSSGLSWAWLGAELIASALCREPPALDAELARLLAPQRFASPSTATPR